MASRPTRAIRPRLDVDPAPHPPTRDLDRRGEVLAVPQLIRPLTAHAEEVRDVADAQVAAFDHPQDLERLRQGRNSEPSVWLSGVPPCGSCGRDATRPGTQGLP
jgi:hypothetical protein